MKEKIWDRIKSKLKNEIPVDSFKEWFFNTEQVAESPSSITVRLVEDYADTLIREHYSTVINKIKSELNITKDIQFVYEDQVAESQRNAAAEVLSLKKSSSKYEKPKFNSAYIFDTFVVGPSNELAQATSLAVTDSPGTMYNPLFIYGGTGLGKTHLLHAIGNEFLNRYPEKKIIFISAEKFTNDYISSIRNKNIDKFKEKYRTADVLLVDDIHFLAGKAGTQEEFFNTFNDLFDTQKQIVLSSDSLPKDIPQLEERLMTRFLGGIVADIKPPNIETRIAILQKKAERHKVELPDDVIYFIAKKIRKNVRELEGALNKVIAIAKINRKELSVEVAKDSLKSHIGDDDEHITPKKIIDYVADYYKISASKMKEKNNTSQVVLPRQVSMYLCKTLTDKSFPEIGKEFGNKHHTTVIYACNKIEKRMQENSKFNRLVNSFITSIS